MKTLYFLCSIFSGIILFGQNPELQWEKYLNEYGEGWTIYETEDNGYVLFLTKYEGTQSSFQLLKLDADRNIVWEHTYENTENANAASMLKTEDGGYLLFGNTLNAGSEEDLWLVKVNLDGNVEWQKQYGGSQSERASKLIKTVGNGYLLVASSYSSDGDLGGNFGSSDFWLVKINEVGDIDWENNLGTTAYDECVSAVPTLDGGFMVVGKSEFSEYYEDYLVYKINESGELDWVETYGGNGDDNPQGILQEHNDADAYLVFGISESTDGDISNPLGMGDGWVIKLDAEGVIIWDKSFGGNKYDTIIDFRLSESGGYLYSGSYGYESTGGVYLTNTCVAEVDNDGTEIWKFLLGSVGWGGVENYPREIKYAADGNLLMMGFHSTDQYFLGWLAKLGITNLGISNDENSFISIYPNPTKDFVQIQWKEKPESIKVYNSSGQFIKLEEKISSNPFTLNVQNLSKGVYFITVTTKNYTYSQKLIIE